MPALADADGDSAALPEGAAAEPRALAPGAAASGVQAPAPYTRRSKRRPVAIGAPGTATVGVTTAGPDVRGTAGRAGGASSWRPTAARRSARDQSAPPGEIDAGRLIMTTR